MGEKNGVEHANVVKQIEYYFGDVNLVRDKFLLSEIAKNDGGWVDVAVMMKFNRLSKLCGGVEDSVLDAVEGTGEEGLLEVDRENRRLRRKLSKPLPEDKQKFLSEAASRSVYLKGFDKTLEQDAVEKLLESHGPFESVFLRRWKDTESKMHFKGSVMVTFPSLEAAEKFMALPEVKINEEALEKKWKNDWSLEKEEEHRARIDRFKQRKLEKKKPSNAASTPPKKRKIEEFGENDERPEKKQKKEGDEDDEEKQENVEPKEDNMGMLPGSVFKLDGIPSEGVHVRDLKSVLGKVLKDDIAYIAFESGDTSAVVRLKGQDSALKALESIKASEEKLEVKDTELTASAMEKEEEEKFLTGERLKKKELQSKIKNSKKAIEDEAEDVDVEAVVVGEDAVDVDEIKFRQRIVSIVNFQSFSKYLRQVETIKMQGKMKVKNKGQVPNLKKGKTQLIQKKKLQKAANRTTLTKVSKVKTQGEKVREALAKDIQDKILSDVTRRASAAGTTLHILKTDESS